MLTLALAMSLRNDGNYCHSCLQTWTARLRARCAGVKVGTAAWASPVCAFRLTFDEDSSFQGYDAVSIGRVATFHGTLLLPSAGSESLKNYWTLKIEAARC
jgi:hypothetical protein